jgi:hypothetical protein
MYYVRARKPKQDFRLAACLYHGRRSPMQRPFDDDGLAILAKDDAVLAIRLALRYTDRQQF